MTTHPASRTPGGGRAWFDGLATLLRKLVSGEPPKSCRVCEGHEKTRARVGPRRGEHVPSEEQIDQASEDSFPASDPPSWNGSGP